MSNFDAGYNATLASLGITKEARIWPALRGFGQRFAKNFKQIAVGSPLQATKEIMAGKALKPGGLIRAGFDPGKGKMGLLMGGLFYGLPAYQAYKVYKSDAPNKAEEIGKILGGTAAGLGTWRAYGMLGSMLATPIGERLGGAAGRLGQTLAGKPVPKEAPPPPPPRTGMLPAQSQYGMYPYY